MIANPWQVQIYGWGSDLEHLAQYFVSTPRRIVKDERDASFLYESDTFEGYDQPDQVLKLANEELHVLSGVLKVTRNSPEPLRTGGVYKKNASGGKDAFIYISETLHVHDEVDEVTITSIDHHGNTITRPIPPPRTVAIAQLAAADAAVAKVMRLFAAPDHKSWVSMYRIHEVIEADTGGEHRLKTRGWGSVQDLSRFKHSANSVTVAGDSARHGKELARPPTNPMTIDEGVAYLNYVLQSWLSSKSA
ncbi:hypothetical protein [Paralcaligenes ureilyticus]|uniref:Uncharacterized protein n=1 Tax=Paralcaligenes ureilyticus TaxID=627131 RepID=A0A4R3M6L5_9BURK|nr:hypothetical protein [Paralcaligenes ureilyticus]TCT09054.1 hypothetical protein EDC26_104214 [Paralcaligenes ureilyticus]